ncbi:hypothetical protein KGM_212119 [Danaus plexippus plexippus]|uniref:Uncharacterized protein n=1 Tax=Danaus plexippus plexippus TaxID=278856 RepID=A0A212EN98_DANPL|nr:hypothetical protein KGM_212119 [Danaus plexippus plexippus]
MTKDRLAALQAIAPPATLLNEF